MFNLPLNPLKWFVTKLDTTITGAINIIHANKNWEDQYLDVKFEFIKEIIVTLYDIGVQPPISMRNGLCNPIYIPTSPQ